MIVTEDEIVLRTLLGTTLRMERQTGGSKSIEVDVEETREVCQDRNKQDNDKANGKFMLKLIMPNNAAENSLSILRTASILPPKVSYPTT
jgi:hypothetical protein